MKSIMNRACWGHKIHFNFTVILFWPRTSDETKKPVGMSIGFVPFSFYVSWHGWELYKGILQITIIAKHRWNWESVLCTVAMVISLAYVFLKHKFKEITVVKTHIDCHENNIQRIKIKVIMVIESFKNNHAIFYCKSSEHQAAWLEYCNIGLLMCMVSVF